MPREARHVGRVARQGHELRVRGRVEQRLARDQRTPAADDRCARIARADGQLVEEAKCGRTGAMLPLLAAALAATSYSLTVPTPATARKRLSGEMARRLGCCGRRERRSAIVRASSSPRASPVRAENSVERGMKRRTWSWVWIVRLQMPDQASQYLRAGETVSEGGQREVGASLLGRTESRRSTEALRPSRGEVSGDSPDGAVIAASDEDDAEGVCGCRLLLWGRLRGLRREVGRVRQGHTGRHGVVVESEVSV